MKMLNIALPKGRLGEKAYGIFEKIGCGCPEIREDILKGDAKKSVAFRSEMVKRGYMFIPAEPKRLVVSYSHTEADIDETLNVAEDVLKAMKEAGTV